MAVVYLARQISLDRLVALKTVSAALAAESHGRERFRREARAVAQLEHPRIVSIHDIGTSAGAMYYTMDYIAGRDLGRAMQERTIPLREAASIVQKVAEAIEHAHQRGVLHRDLKPGNILLDEADEPHVTDFGIALETAAASGLTLNGDVLGTPPYMAPEALAGGPGKSGPASEVYALGAILYHLLTGRTPFTGSSASEILHLALAVPPPSPRVLNPAIPRDLETICLKCLEKSPESRYRQRRRGRRRPAAFPRGREHPCSSNYRAGACRTVGSASLRASGLARAARGGRAAALSALSTRCAGARRGVGQKHRGAAIRKSQ